MWQTYSTLLVQHQEVVNSEILDLAFIAFWNETSYMYARARKNSHAGGKCVTCCGLPYLVGITGPKWRKIKTAVICKNAHYT
jgi:hypothetical protein